MKKILILKGQSQYNALRYFADQLRDSFISMGHETNTVDLLTITTYDEFKKALVDKPDLVVSFNGMGSEINALRDYPVFTHCVDHPMYQMERVVKYTDNITYGFADKRHQSFVDKFVGTGMESIFLPQGACVVPDLQELPKDYDIFFAGSLFDLAEIDKHIKSLGSFPQKAVKYLIDLQTEDSSLNVDERLLELQAAKPFYFKKLTLQTILKILYYADTYVRSKRRVTCIDFLAKQGYKILLMGAEWKKEDYKDNVTILPPLDFYDTYKEMQRAKFCLNILPTYAAGGHERIFTSMLNKIPVITDSSEYLLEELTHNYNILLFNWKNLDDIPGMLENADISAITNNAYNNVLENHMWKNRAETILKNY